MRRGILDDEQREWIQLEPVARFSSLQKQEMHDLAGSRFTVVVKIAVRV